MASWSSSEPSSGASIPMRRTGSFVPSGMRTLIVSPSVTDATSTTTSASTVVVVAAVVATTVVKVVLVIGDKSGSDSSRGEA